MILEEFLISNGFDLDTYYGTNKRFIKKINDRQSLYVRIFSDVNKIVDVEYESLALTNFNRNVIVEFETITTIEQLNFLIKALVINRLFSNESYNNDFFEVVFGSSAGTYNLKYVVDYAKQFGFICQELTDDLDYIIDACEQAEVFIQNLCAENILFGCTENGDWVFAHKLNQCWN